MTIISPNYLFKDYVYVSGTSPVFVKHFEEYAKFVISEFDLHQGSLVVEIGSNDGTLLKYFQDAGMKVLGIDPAIGIAKKATDLGIETMPVFFNAELAKILRNERGPASIITANNVFAHVDDLIGFTQGVRELLAEDGVFIFEVSYLVDVFEKTLFDTIYHEHLSYHSVGPLCQYFKAQGLELIEVTRIKTHGGSLRGIAQLSSGHRKVSKSVVNLINLESKLKLDKAYTLKHYSNKIDKLKQKIQLQLYDLKKSGKSIIGYGAPAKATTLMYHFGLGTHILDFIVDDSPLKQGLYSPGLHVPILSRSAINDKKPDYILILAWNFASSIIKNNRKFSEFGCKYFIPLPEIEII